VDSTQAACHVTIVCDVTHKNSQKVAVGLFSQFPDGVPEHSKPVLALQHGMLLRATRGDYTCYD